MIQLLLSQRVAPVEEFIMPYTYKGQHYSIASPVISISVNKLNIVVKDQAGSMLFEFTDRKESKAFLNLLCQA